MTKTMNFEEALALLKECKKVKLNNWKDDVYIAIDFSDGCVHLGAMTAPYMYVTSRYGRVPWMPTQIEIMSNEWVEYDFEEEKKPIPTVIYKETVEDIVAELERPFNMNELLEHIKESIEEINDALEGIIKLQNINTREQK